jgi:hypothetical protein
MKKELVSFNEVVRDIPSLVELDDAMLDQVVGGAVAGTNAGYPTYSELEDKEYVPGCNTLC